MKNTYKLIGSVVVCLFAGFIGSLFTSVSDWYFSLNKPWFNPPSFVFAPVWTLLYVLMGISLYFVLGKKKAMVFFGLQLILNVLWSFLFFSLRMPLYAFIEIILLWVMILLTIFEFYKVNRVAAYLLIPYILWVSFAAVLNLFIVLMN